ncbi:tetraspanin-13 isoform X2 [Aphidius gifuensis]|uniref:tetraspanin-13 isoform X2 n=1 Tax=Aphidius gifuensis TaxID=684658 RepID=UPI001CDB6774|nr:tetraspanin-13 isoform X2 [Aphidius gifuensis]
MCGGFTCSKNALTALNVLYIVVAFILIGVAVYGRASAIVTNLPIIGGILACGVVLILISVLGLIGAVKHHQVLLFFYMLVLFLLFLVQFSIACACLAVNEKQQEQLAEQGWKRVGPAIKAEVQTTFMCCGFNDTTVPMPPVMDHPSCDIVNIKCCSDPRNDACLNGVCKPCMKKLQSTINDAFKLCGGIGLFFSFTEFVGVWLTVRYRNQKDPRANPSAFL